MNLKNWTAIAIGVALSTGAAETFAQHYPAGAEGVRAATLPPPGIYLRDYNLMYFAPKESLPVTDLFVYMNAPRVIWISDIEILGANYGMDLIVPFGYVQVKYRTFFGAEREESRFGLGDIQFEPLLLTWHTKQFDIAAGYAIWAPTGDFDANRVANIGNGYWTHMLTAGATWNIDEEKTWAVSVLNRYEISTGQEQTHITPGQLLTIEAGVSKALTKRLEVGVAGYWQHQTTQTSRGGNGFGSLGHVGAVGPEITTLIPGIDTPLSVRYLREFEAKDTLEGNVVSVTLTRRF